MHIEIRPWDVEDAMELRQLLMHPYFIRKQIWKYLYPITFLQAVAMIHFYQNANPHKYRFRAITCDGKVCGYIECTKRASTSCEIAYWLGVPYWKQGIMKEAIKKICEEIFREMHVVCINARVEKKNIASQIALTYNGFLQEEKDGYFVYKRYL